MGDYKNFHFIWKKFVLLEQVLGMPQDFVAALKKLEYTHGYYDDCTGDFLIKKDKPEIQILRQILPGDWMMIYPRIRFDHKCKDSRTIILPL